MVLDQAGDAKQSKAKALECGSSVCGLRRNSSDGGCEQTQTNKQQCGTIWPTWKEESQGRTLDGAPTPASFSDSVLSLLSVALASGLGLAVPLGESLSFPFLIHF